MLVINQQLTVGSKRVFRDGSGLDSELPTCVLCSISVEVEEYEEEQSTEVDNEMNLVPERRAAIEISREKAGLIMYISMGRPGLQFSSKTVTSTIAKPPEITKSRLGKIARYLEDKPALECVHACQNEVNWYMAFDWAGHADQQQRCWKS